MSIGYRLMYRLGATPWEHEHIEQPLVDLVEGQGALPAGRALDIGCGTGRDAVYLAQHGWDVTGIDAVPKALKGARARSRRAGVPVRWVHGDIGAPNLDLKRELTLLVDLGCFHGLTSAQQQVAADTMTNLAAPGATLLLFAFSPGRRGPAPRGMDQSEVLTRFAGWELSWARPATDVTLRGPLRNANPFWYQLTAR